MNFDKVINERRSIRKYQNKEVAETLITQILKAGIKAPSAHNRQPWLVKVIKGKEKDQIYKALLTKKDQDYSIETTATTIKEAPILIAVFYNRETGNRDNDILSIGAFIENMHLKATELGLGSLWIANTNYIEGEIKEICKTTKKCVSTLAIGYKDQNPKERPRKELNEILLEDK